MSGGDDDLGGLMMAWLCVLFVLFVAALALAVSVGWYFGRFLVGLL